MDEPSAYIGATVLIDDHDANSSRLLVHLNIVHAGTGKKDVPDGNGIDLGADIRTPE